MKTILSVVVGSQLHGIANEDSDTDVRGIFVHDMIDIISPFRKVKNTSWVEGDEDNTAYELRDFCKYATKGNATILEILWSNMIRQRTSLGVELQENRHRFLDSCAIYEAHKGYAANQMAKMSLFTPDKRTPKFAVAYLRVLQQAKQLLTSGDFSPQITSDLDFIRTVKYHFSDDLIPELGIKFTQLQTELAQIYFANANKYTPDIEWIEDFLIRAYRE